MSADKRNLQWRSETNSWYFRKLVRGKEVRRHLQTDRLREARKKRDQILKELAHLKYHGETRHSWSEAVGKWTVEYLPGNVKSGTAKRYLVSIGQLDPWLGGLYVDQIDKRLVAKIVSERTSARKASGRPTNATKRKDLTAMSSVLQCCIGWGWIEGNAAREYDRGLIKEQKKPFVLPTDEEIEAIIEAAPDMMARMTRVAWKTGMRQDEIVALKRRGQLKLDDREIYLPETKTSEPRVIPLDDPICREVVGTFSGTPIHLKSPYVFWAPEGGAYKNFSSCFAGVRARLNARRKKLGLPAITMTFHALRHRFAVDYLRATRSPQCRRGDVYRLAEILGHASVKTTEEYLKYVKPLGTESGTDITVSAQDAAG